jgi:hypothetical protein
MRLIVGIVAGIGCLVAGIWAARWNWRQQALRGWRFWVMSALSLAAGVVPGQLSYSVDARTRIVGVPFPAAAFQLEDGVWLDFVGPLTGPFMLANTFCWAGLGQVVLLFCLRWRRRRIVAVQQ